MSPSKVPEQIIVSKSFDYGTACLSEQAIIAEASISRQLQHEMRMRGAYFCSASEADRLAAVIFSNDRDINPQFVGQSPQVLARAADFDVPPNTRCLVATESTVGWDRPLSAEKLNPVLAFYISAFSKLPVGRVLVNTPAITGGMGYSTDLEPSFMLGTGTWSGSITSDNVTALHLINIKRVACEHKPWRSLYEEYA